MNTPNEVDTWASMTRRFSGVLTLLMVLSYLVAAAAISAFRSGVPSPGALVTNLVMFFLLGLPWIAVIAVVGFFGSWALMQIGPRSAAVVWWWGGLVAFTTAIVISLAHFVLNSWVDHVTSVHRYGEGAATAALAGAAQATLFVILASASGIALSLRRRAARGKAADGNVHHASALPSR